MFRQSIVKTQLFWWVALLAAPIFGQTANPEALFNQGLILYRNNDFTQAKANFQKLAAMKENNPRETIGLLLLAKSAFHLEQFDEAIDYASRLIEQCPTSSYLADAYYVRASAFFQKKNYNDAVDNFAYAVEFARSSELRRLAETAATNIVDGSISLKKIDELYGAYPWEQARPIITIWRAHIQYKNNRTAEANKILENFLDNKPEARYAAIAEQLLKKDSGVTTDQVRVGIIQPMSGFFSSESQDFVRGLAFALKRRARGGPEIALILKDTKGDIVQTINSTLELKDAQVDLVISDLEGSRSATIAGLLKNSGIPVIVPTSTENNLTKISDEVFQFNNDMETRGAALADYAVKTLGMKTFATLAPADDYGNAITDAFTNRVDELKGTIVAQQWYYPGTTDFAPQLEAIREAGFRFAYRDSLRAWGMDVNMARVDSIYERLDRNARRRSEDNETLAQYTNIAVRSIDGLFAPIYEEAVPYVSSQFALYNIKARLLGGDTWNNIEMLRKQQRYTNGVVYVGGLYLSEIDLDYINFVRDFRIASSTSPGVMAYYGYNVMNLIIEAVNAGNTTGGELADYLLSVKEFKGLGTNISFKKEQRVNGYVNILQFQDGLIQKLNVSGN